MEEFIANPRGDLGREPEERPLLGGSVHVRIGRGAEALDLDKLVGGPDRLAAGRAGATLRIVIEDDGPGLAAEDRARAFARGDRLDEAVPGSGLGLAIVREIAELYGGGVELGVAGFGGLRVELTLPAAEG